MSKNSAVSFDLSRFEVPEQKKLRWTFEEAFSLYHQPFNDLLFQAQQVHRQNFNPNEVQISQLLSIKTGNCPEDCAYCPQSKRYQTGLTEQDLLEVEEVITKAREAKRQGSTRFCMGAAWRSPKDKHLAKLRAMIQGVKSLGLETCMTLGMLTGEQAQSLAQAGLDYYNHNLDTSEDYYSKIITTRSYASRLSTLEEVRRAGIKVCSGGILGLGEGVADRLNLLLELSNLEEPPSSVPLNMLVKVSGTPLGDVEDIDPLEFIRTLAVARILLPTSYLRLSAGREQMSDSTQALAFLAGANSIFYGEQLLTTTNPTSSKDKQLLERLGLQTSLPRTTNKVNQAEQDKTINKTLFYNAAPLI